MLLKRTRNLKKPYWCLKVFSINFKQGDFLGITRGPNKNIARRGFVLLLWFILNVFTSKSLKLVYRLVKLVLV